MSTTPPTVSRRGGAARSARALVLAALAATSMTLAACGLPSIPADPDGTLDRIRAEEVLRAGASANPPLVVTAEDEPPTGEEAELIDGFAERLGVEVEWIVGGESELVGKLEDGAVNVIVGGLLDDSPWEQRVTLTRPYSSSEAPDGTTRQHVMATPLGENALLFELERYLDDVRQEESS